MSPQSVSDASWDEARLTMIRLRNECVKLIGNSADLKERGKTDFGPGESTNH